MYTFDIDDNRHTLGLGYKGDSHALSALAESAWN